VAGYRKAVVRENLQRAFPDKSATEVTVLAKKFYRQLAQVALEIVKARRMTQAQFRQRVNARKPGVELYVGHLPQPQQAGQVVADQIGLVLGRLFIRQLHGVHKGRQLVLVVALVKVLPADAAGVSL